ncbi:hypothetical protein Tco_0303668 [Tanacetum coccineum]
MYKPDRKLKSSWLALTFRVVGGRGVKEKSIDRNKTNTVGIGLFTASDGILNEVTPVSVVIEGVTPFVVDMDVEKEKLSALEDTTILGSFPALPTQVTTSAGNAPAKGNRIDVVVPMESIRAISEQFVYTAYGFFLREANSMLENGLWFIHNNLLILKIWHSDENLLKEDGRSSYARVMIKLRADVELNDNIVMAMPKINREGHYICNVHVEYEWKPPRCATCKVFGHIHEECPKNTGAEYRPVLKNPTASSNDNKKKCVEPTIEVSNLVNNGATSSGSSFMNVDNTSIGTSPIIDKIKKFEELLTSGKAILVDEAGNPWKKVEFSGDYDSEDEVALFDNDMARSIASERVGFGTQSLLEQ